LVFGPVGCGNRPPRGGVVWSIRSRCQPLRGNEWLRAPMATGWMARNSRAKQAEGPTAAAAQVFRRPRTFQPIAASRSHTPSGPIRVSRPRRPGQTGPRPDAATGQLPRHKHHMAPASGPNQQAQAWAAGCSASPSFPRGASSARPLAGRSSLQRAGVAGRGRAGEPALHRDRQGPEVGLVLP